MMGDLQRPLGDTENLINCLKLIRDIRSSSKEVWKSTSEGLTWKHGEGHGSSEKTMKETTSKYLMELKQKLDGVSNLIKDLETNLTKQQPIVTPLPLGHSVYLSLDASLETVPVYGTLVTSYKWLDKTHDYSEKAVSYLTQNSLNRSHGKVAKNRRRLPNTSLTLPPQELDNVLNNVSKRFANISFNVSRPNGSKLHAIVEVSLDRILKSFLVFKGLMIEWVIVKGYGEDMGKKDGTGPDIWTPSRYQVFRRITENVNAAMLNYFQSPHYPEVCVKTFMTYLHSYVTLFTDKCRKCGYHLHNNIPPTWREFKSLEPFHEDCKP